MATNDSPSRIEVDYDQNPEETSEPSTHDQLADEALEAAEKPQGAPEFIPAAVALGTRNRALRAEFFALIQDADAINHIDTETTQGAAILMDVLAKLEQAMGLVVHPAAKLPYKEWVKKADDEDLLQLFNWYMSEMQPGEASPSPS